MHTSCFAAWHSLALFYNHVMAHPSNTFECSTHKTTQRTHTLDKNGSLYDPAGTESCNVQIQKVRIAMLITEIKYQIATTVKWKYSCAVLGLAACHVSQNCNEKMQVRPAGQAGYPISLVASLDTVPGKCCVSLHYLKREKREEKRRKFYIYPDVTHTHTRQSRENPERQEEEKSGHTTSKRPKTAQGGEGNRRTSGTNLHGETDLTKTAHTPKPHDTLRRGTRGKLGTKWGTSWWQTRKPKQLIKDRTQFLTT